MEPCGTQLLTNILPEGQESAYQAVNHARTKPRNRWDLSSNVLGSAWGIKGLRQVLAKNASDHRQRIANFGEKNKQLES